MAYFDDEASSQHESDLDQEEYLYSDEETEVDEDNLPMFEHEEFPPEVDKSKYFKSFLGSRVVDGKRFLDSRNLFKVRFREKGITTL